MLYHAASVSIHNCLELARAVAFEVRNAVRKGVPAADPAVATLQAVMRFGQ